MSVGESYPGKDFALLKVNGRQKDVADLERETAELRRRLQHRQPEA